MLLLDSGLNISICINNFACAYLVINNVIFSIIQFRSNEDFYEV